MPDGKHVVYKVITQYKCGAEVGFLARNKAIAVATAAKIALSDCPECKLKAGIKLDDQEIEVMLAGFLTELDHEKAKMN
jgi:hypothetical protein